MGVLGGWLSYGIFGLILPLIFTVSFVVFVWGSMQYFVAGGFDEEAREKGKALMFYALIVLTIVGVAAAVLRYVANALS